MSTRGAGPWESAHPRLTSFLGLLERWAARIPTARRAAPATASTKLPPGDPELLPLGVIEGAASDQAVVALLDDTPASFGPAGHGKDATG